MKAFRYWLMAAGALALAACDSAPHADSRGDTAPSAQASPALWQIASKNGDIEGWLFGTIHALPDGTGWRTATLDHALSDAEFLVVEVGELGDKAALARGFNALALSPDELAPLSERVPVSRKADLLRELALAGLDEDDFERTDTWAAALTLAQAANPAKSANGTDLTLIRQFDGKRIEPLETAALQFSLFDDLPESEQSDLLTATLDEISNARADPVSLAEHWLTGNIAALEAKMAHGLLADPQLREVLLTRRNAAWIERIAQDLPKPDQPFIAVGTAHLIGPEGLVAGLEAQGYTVTRLQ